MDICILAYILYARLEHANFKGIKYIAHEKDQNFFTNAEFYLLNIAFGHFNFT